MYAITEFVKHIENIELLDISYAKLEKHTMAKIENCENRKSCSDNSVFQKIKQITQTDFTSKNVWIIYKICMSALFDTSLLSESDIFRFQKAVFEMLCRKAGFNRVKSLLLLKLAGEICDDFPSWTQKILITSSTKAFFRPNNLERNRSRNEFLHEIALPFGDYSADLSPIIMHESTHLYNFRTLGDIVGNNDSLKQKLTTKNFVTSALNNSGLREILFPSHVKENFYKMVAALEEFFEKHASLTFTADFCDTLSDLYKSLMKNDIAIPVADLISGWNITNVAFNYVNKKIAELVTAAVISSRNYWENRDETLTILGLVPAKTKDKTVVIFSDESENTFLEEDNAARVSYGKYFFKRTPNSCLQKVLQSMQIKYDDIFDVLHQKMEQIAVSTYRKAA